MRSGTSTASLKHGAKDGMGCWRVSETRPTAWMRVGEFAPYVRYRAYSDFELAYVLCNQRFDLDPEPDVRLFSQRIGDRVGGKLRCHGQTTNERSIWSTMSTSFRRPWQE